MKKIAVVTGARSEYGLLRWVIDEIHHATELQLQLIVTGGHLSPEQGLTYRCIEEDGYDIDAKVDMLLSSDCASGIAKSMGMCSIGMSDAFLHLQPDMIVVLGDRYELLPIVGTALVMRIPIAHISGGDITEGAIDNEVRNAVTMMSTLHFPGTQTSAARIGRMIGTMKNVFVVGETNLDNFLRLSLLSRNELAESLNIDLGKILPGLSTKITGNYIINDYARKKYMSHQKAYNFQSGDPDNRFIPGPLDLNKYNIYTFGSNYENLTYGARQFWNEQFDWTLNYKNSFGKHEVGGMITFEQAESQGEAIYATANDPLTDYDQWFVFSTDPERRTVSVNESENLGSHLSWIGRATYNYDSKYMAEFSFRYDGNNKFPKDRRWGFFSSASLGWRISREAFMENTSEWLDDLKIRASYGTTGNDLNTSNKSIGYFQYIERYTTGSSYMFGKGLANGIQTGSMPTTDLTWATSATINGGIDFTLLSNRLSGTIDGFYRKETDILGSRTTTLPSTYGASLAPENYAERSWRGGEFTLTWRDKVQHGINYSLYMNIGYSKDRWDVLDESVIYMTGNLKDLSLVGMSAGRITGLKVDHLLTDQAEVDELIAKGFKQYGRDPYLGGLLFQDTRGDGYSLGPDGKIDGNDAYNLLSENGTPRINYGFGGSFSWKGITIDMHFQGVGSYDRLVGCDATKGIPQYGGNTRPYYPIWTSDKCWSPENPNGVYPRVIGKNQYESGYGNTDFWMRNGAYVRLKNLNIGYNLPASILRPLGLLHAQVFMNATNLFSISAMNEFMDPEQKYYDSFPLMRSFTFGLNFSF